MNNIELVVILSSYNRLLLLQKALTSVYSALGQCSKGAAIVIFEAGSNDGSREWLPEFIEKKDKEQGPSIPIEIILAAPEDDRSFSAGVNSACSYAAAKFPNTIYYFLYETDNWLSSIEPTEIAMRLLSKEDCLAGVGFTVQKHSGAPAGFGASFPTAGQFLLGQNLTYLMSLDRPRPEWQDFDQGRWTYCDVVFTSPVLFKRKAWEDAKGFDKEAFPFSDCDTDLDFRLRNLGWRLAVLQVAGVVHDNQEQLSQWSQGRVIKYHEARLKLLAKHLGKWVFLLKPLLFLRHCLELVLLLVLCLVKKKQITSLKSREKLISTVFKSYSEI